MSELIRIIYKCRCTDYRASLFRQRINYITISF